MRNLCNIQNHQPVKELYKYKGLKAIDAATIVITLKDIDMFYQHKEIQTALENGEKFYVLIWSSNSSSSDYLIEPKTKKIDGIWRLHGQNLRVFS